MPDATPRPRLLQQPAYRRRVQTLRERIEATGIPIRRWAERIGRSERVVYETLSLAAPSRPVLDRLDAALRAAAAEAPLSEDGGVDGGGVDGDADE